MDNNVISINGEVYDAKNVTLTPTLTSEKAFQLALTNIGAQKYLWEDVEQSKIVDYEKPIGEIVLFPIVKSGVVTLSYKYDIYALEPVSRNEIYVDAHNGKILYKNPIIKLWYCHTFPSII
jgi:Zn-dependent metalloprotease